MVVDFEGTPPNPIVPAAANNSNVSNKSHASLLSPFGLLGTAAWFGGGGGDQFDSEPSEEEKAAEDAAKKIVAECKVRGIFYYCYWYIVIIFILYFDDHEDIILGTKDLRSDSLVYLVKALILSSVRPKLKKTVSSTPASSSTPSSTLSNSSSGLSSSSSGLPQSSSNSSLSLSSSNSSTAIMLVPNSAERVALFCLNLLTHITLINHERIIISS